MLAVCYAGHRIFSSLRNVVFFYPFWNCLAESFNSYPSINCICTVNVIQFKLPTLCLCLWRSIVWQQVLWLCCFTKTTPWTWFSLQSRCSAPAMLLWQRWHYGMPVPTRPRERAPSARRQISIRKHRSTLCQYARQSGRFVLFSMHPNGTKILTGASALTRRTGEVYCLVHFIVLLYGRRVQGL